jgi:hypothetical protein
MVEKYKKKNA